MQVIDLSVTANQSLVTTQDNNRYEIRIFECNGAMAADVTRDGVVLFSGSRMTIDLPLIPYAYMQGTDGNFFLVSLTDDEPYYTLFGSQQSLIYASAAEMSAA